MGISLNERMDIDPNSPLHHSYNTVKGKSIFFERSVKVFSCADL